MLTCWVAADVKSLIEAQGATFSATVDDGCTHLITTEKDAAKRGTKCKYVDLWKAPHFSLLTKRKQINKHAISKTARL